MSALHSLIDLDIIRDVPHPGCNCRLVQYQWCYCLDIPWINYCKSLFLQICIFLKPGPTLSRYCYMGNEYTA